MGYLVVLFAVAVGVFLLSRIIACKGGLQILVLTLIFGGMAFFLYIVVNYQNFGATMRNMETKKQEADEGIDLWEASKGREE